MNFVSHYQLIVNVCADYDMPSPDFGAVYDDVLEDPAQSVCDTEALETFNPAKSEKSLPLLLKCRWFTVKCSIRALYLNVMPYFQVHTKRTKKKTSQH